MTQLGIGSQPLSAVAALAIQPDGKILAGGDASPASGNPAFMVERLGTNGTPDAAFGSGGKVVSQLGQGFGAFSAVASLALQPDGNVLAGGVATDADGDSALLLARLSWGRRQPRQLVRQRRLAASTRPAAAPSRPPRPAESRFSPTAGSSPAAWRMRATATPAS